MVQNLLHVRDEKATTVEGGTPSAGVNNRNLNTVLTNEITGASLSSNQIILPTGTYEITAMAPCYRGALHRAFLYNVTDAAVEIVGGNNFAREVAGDDAHQNKSPVRGRFTITAEKTFELRHQIASTNGGTSGLGKAVGEGPVEVYSDVQIREIVDDFDLLHVRDEKTANTDGGGSSVATFNIRDINTVMTNEISGSSISSNQIILPAGTYHIEASVPVSEASRHKALLWNDTASEYTHIGQNMFTRGSLIHADRCRMLSQFLILETTTFEIHHFTAEAEATDGLGRKMNDGKVEVYTEVIIRKVI